MLTKVILSGINKLEWSTIPACPSHVHFLYNIYIYHIFFIKVVLTGLTPQSFMFVYVLFYVAIGFVDLPSERMKSFEMMYLH